LSRRRPRSSRFATNSELKKLIPVADRAIDGKPRRVATFVRERPDALFAIGESLPGRL
jgi:hypothetical protein